MILIRQWVQKGAVWVSPILLMGGLASCSQAPFSTSQGIAGGEIAKKGSEPSSVSLTLDSAKSEKSAKPGKVAQAGSAEPAIADFKTNQRLAGFSADGKYFIHLESWRDTGAGLPHAALQILDVASNTCVPKGCITTNYREGDDQISLETAEKSLLRQTQQLRQTLKLDAPVAGTSTPLTAQSRTPDGTEKVTAQVGRQQPLEIQLQQQRVMSVMDGGTADKDKAAMQLDVIYGGQRRSLASLDQFHDWVMDFSIREVVLSPDGKKGVILLTSAKRSFEGNLGRTMVQGFEF